LIYELRTYKLIPGQQAKFVKLAAEGLRIRGESYGRLVGYWTSELGMLNQIFHLWSFESVEARAQLLGQLSTVDEWKTSYLPEARPMIQMQESALLSAVHPVEPPPRSPNIYELRRYTAHPGKSAEWLALFRAASSRRLALSHLVGAWMPDVGPLNQILSLWTYSDLNERAHVRKQAASDPTWHEFLQKVPPLLVSMEATILTPTTFSPLQ
jgi:hypothetical protein